MNLRHSTVILTSSEGQNLCRLELCGEELAADPEVVECVSERGSVRVSGTAQQLGMGVRLCRDKPETLPPFPPPPRSPCPCSLNYPSLVQFEGKQN